MCQSTGKTCQLFAVFFTYRKLLSNIPAIYSHLTWIFFNLLTFSPGKIPGSLFLKYSLYYPIVSYYVNYLKLEYVANYLYLLLSVLKVVEQYDEERRARLLQFVTGSSRIPIQGFKALQGITCEIFFYSNEN